MSDSGFDAAIRQNRRGKIRVNIEVDGHASSALALLRGRMLVLSNDSDWLDRAFGVQSWEGYSPDFAPLELGAAAPEYQALFHLADDGVITLAGMRPYRGIS